MTLKIELEQLIEKVGLKHYTRSLKSRPEFLQRVIDATSFLDETAELPERVWNILHEEKGFSCKRGSRIKFNTLVKGYHEYCSSRCECANESRAKEIDKHYTNLSEEEKQRRLIKTKKTLKEKYGVDHAMHIPGVKEKMEETNLQIYGVVNYTLSQEGKDKISDLYNALSDEEKESRKQKAKDSNLKKYGAPNTMHIARQAFSEQNGGKNPFQIPEYDEKRRNTMLEKYGCDRPLENKEILTKMLEDNIRKFGNVHYANSDSAKQKNMEKFGREFCSQKHISEEAYGILQDKEKLRKSLEEEKSVVILADKLKIGHTTLFNYITKYELKIEKTKSSYEIEICDYLKNTCGFSISENNRKIIAPQELDIVIPDKKIAIEICGLYWHSEIHKQDNYHLTKLKAANDAGYRLITIFEDEYLFNKNIVYSRLKNILGLSQKGIGARKLKIERISWTLASEFLKKHHIQSCGTFSEHCYGAFDDSMLVAVMTFTEPNISKGGKSKDFIELNRFATDGRNHTGVASKLLAHFRKEHNDRDIVSYADLRWSAGNLYEQLGFEYVGNTKANYYYIKDNKRYHRWKFRKSEIINLVENGINKTEREIMLELNYARIYDCGNKKYIFKAQ